MRLGQDWFCDTRGNPGCETHAAATFICPVEGREVSLCGPCSRAWKEKARDTPGLQHRCPNCAPQFLEGLRLAEERAGRRIKDGHGVLTGPIADLVDKAMYQNGILADQRRRVLEALYRLATESDDYSAVLLRSTMPDAAVPA